MLHINVYTYGCLCVGWLPDEFISWLALPVRYTSRAGLSMVYLFYLYSLESDLDGNVNVNIGETSLINNDCPQFSWKPLIHKHGVRLLNNIRKVLP